MNPSKDNAHLHLVTVGEEQIVLGSVPHPVESERVSVVALELSDNRSSVCLGGMLPLPGARPEGEGQGEDIVINETGEDRKDGHDESNISSVEKHSEKFKSNLLE